MLADESTYAFRGMNDPWERKKVFGSRRCVVGKIQKNSFVKSKSHSADDAVAHARGKWFVECIRKLVSCGFHY